MHHYTYVIHKESSGEYYIGVRSCEHTPQEDPYMGSSSYLNSRLHEGDWFKFITQEFPTRKEAADDEIYQLKSHINNGLCINRNYGGDGWRQMSDEAEARRIASVKVSNARPEKRARQGVAMRVTLARPDVKARQSAASKAVHNQPDVEARRHTSQLAALQRPDVIARRSAAQTEANARTEVRVMKSVGMMAVWLARKQALVHK